MTDLYEALRAAIAPDGRVRLTLPLLTAMREEAERRERGESIEVLRERAETAERELEGAEREADEQRERRKRAEVERDAAHARAEKASDAGAARMERQRDVHCEQESDVEEHLPEYVCDAEGNEANVRERIEFAGRDLRDLITHARACLDPEIVSRDPAHARLAALLERIEGES
jgi:hypothetical protein